MKKNIAFICCFLIFFSCKNINLQKNVLIKEKVSDSLFIPKYVLIKPNYQENKPTSLTKTESFLHKKIVLKLKKFLYDNEEVDLSPDYDYDGLSEYSSSEKPHREVYFNAKKINKEYLFYYEKEKLICVLEGIYDDDAIFKGDSLFVNNGKIFLWKNTNNLFVTDSIFLEGKSKYIMRLDKEIREIKELGFTQYIDGYIYKSDSLSNFVIGNLKQ